MFAKKFGMVPFGIEEVSKILIFFSFETKSYVTLHEVARKSQRFQINCYKRVVYNMFLS